jgi:type IV secretory pathway protease TraF
LESSGRWVSAASGYVVVHVAGWWCVVRACRCVSVRAGACWCVLVCEPTSPSFLHPSRTFLLSVVMLVKQQMHAPVSVCDCGKISMVQGKACYISYISYIRDLSGSEGPETGTRRLHRAVRACSSCALVCLMVDANDERCDGTWDAEARYRTVPHCTVLYSP